MPDSDDSLRALYAAAAMPAGGHPTEDDWERLACGELARAEREKALDHVTRCAECARIYRALDALSEGARAFDAGAPAEPVRGRAFSRWPLLAALATAAALALVVLRPMAPRQAPVLPAGDTFRGGAQGLDPTPLSPQGRVTGRPSELRWRPISAPALYRVVLLDAEGEAVWSSAEVDAAAIAWPPELELSPGSYFWQVLARPRGARDGDRRASALVAFEIVTSSPR